MCLLLTQAASILQRRIRAKFASKLIEPSWPLSNFKSGQEFEKVDNGFVWWLPDALLKANVGVSGSIWTARESRKRLLAFLNLHCILASLFHTSPELHHLLLPHLFHKSLLAALNLGCIITRTGDACLQSCQRRVKTIGRTGL